MPEPVPDPPPPGGEPAPSGGPAPAGDPPLPTEARRALPLLVLGRLASNIGVRFPFTFIAPLAAGLGVPVDALGLALGARELTGLAAPALGRWSDRGARHRLVAGGLAVCGVSLLLSAVAPGLGVMAAGLVLFGFGKGALDTSSNGWIGDHVPFARRGRVIGVVETSWAVAVLLGAPLLGVLIEAAGWRAPFVATGAACLVVAALLARVLGPDRPPVPVSAGPGAAAAGPPPARRRWPHGPALAAMAALALLALGMQLVTVVFGAWLGDAFGFTVAAVGTASVAFGAAELAGSLASARFTDVLGKRRSVITGLVPMVPCLALLGLAEGRTVLAVALFTVVSIGFEFAFVSALPILTELEPDARAATVGQAFAAFTATRAVATVLGAGAYVRWGMGPVGLAAAGVIAVAVVLVTTRVEEPGGEALTPAAPTPPPGGRPPPPR